MAKPRNKLYITYAEHGKVKADVAFVDVVDKVPYCGLGVKDWVRRALFVADSVGVIEGFEDVEGREEPGWVAVRVYDVEVWIYLEFAHFYEIFCFF